MGIGEILFAIFLTLKLLGIISWSWWWITAPIWGVYALVFVCVIGYSAAKSITLRPKKSKAKKTSKKSKSIKQKVLPLSKV